MKKLSHIISAWIYIAIVKVVTKRSKKEIVGNRALDEYGSTLMFSWFIYLTLLIVVLYAVVGSIAYVWTVIYLNYMV